MWFKLKPPAYIQELLVIEGVVYREILYYKYFSADNGRCRPVGSQSNYSEVSEVMDSVII
jgi:hypothetical protein